MKNISPCLRLCLLLATFVVTGIQVFSQSVNWLWQKDYGGPNTDLLAGMSKDANGNLNLTGTLTSDSFLFGDYPINKTYSRTFSLATTNSSGVVEWINASGGTGGDTLYTSVETSGVATNAAGIYFYTINNNREMLGRGKLVVE
jgi:hypothetical protein